MNFFDSILKPSLFKITTDTFGYTASWVPALGTVPLIARVHFKDPVKLDKELVMERTDFKVVDPIMEYLEPDFPGLLESVENGGREIVFIEGVRYGVTEVISKWDGDTRYATLIKQPL